MEVVTEVQDEEPERGSSIDTCLMSLSLAAKFCLFGWGYSYSQRWDERIKVHRIYTATEPRNNYERFIFIINVLYMAS